MKIMTQTNKEYAEALFMIAAEKELLESFSKSLADINEVILKNPEYLEFLSSPAVPISRRLSAIDEAFGNIENEYITSFLKLLCENRRIKELPLCIEEFEQLKTEAQNKVYATVYYTFPLSSEQKEALKQKLEKQTGKNVELTFTLDKSILGGIKVELDGSILDGSAKHYLNKVKGVISQ